MNLHQLLQRREDKAEPIRVGLIGAGKFGSMILSQVQRTPGMRIQGIADLSPDRVRASLAQAGWPEDQFSEKSSLDSSDDGKCFVTSDSSLLIAADGIDLVVDATGNPAAGIRHVLECSRRHRHIIMVNVEADALAGPLLAQRAKDAGIVYSLAYGDQPALICELVDWARTAGFDVVAAGKGTKYLPSYHYSTPDTVWRHWGFTPEMVAKGNYNPRMFNSFLDGTKSAIEMAAVANATGLTPAPDGLVFPPCGADDLPKVMRPRLEGGELHHRGQVEVASSLERDGRTVFRDLRWAVYVTFAADSDYVRQCFKEYGIITDESGNYAAMMRPYHLVGLELGVSIASVGLRGEPTGCPKGFYADVVAIAKHDLSPGDMLDGEGGYTVYGKLIPAGDSLASGGLPIGLAHGLRLIKPVTTGTLVSWDDVAVPPRDEAVSFRREMEAKLVKT